MQNNSLSVRNLVPRPQYAMLAALVLAIASQAQAANAPAAVPGTDTCLQVKNTEARSQCELSRTQFYNGYTRGALASMRKAVDASPKEGILHAMMARAAMRLSDFGTAERELREARKNGAPEDFVLPVLFNAMVNQHEEVNLLNEFPDPGPNAKGDVARMTLQGRALALQFLGRLPEAAAAQDRALALRRDTDGLLQRSKIAADQHDLALADKLTDEAYKQDPHNLSAMAVKLRQLERVGNDAGVLNLTDQILKTTPAAPIARVARIKIFLKRNDEAKMKEEVAALFAKEPKSALGTYYNAVLMSRAKDKKGAAQAISSLPPDFVRTFPEYGAPMAQIMFDNGNVESGAGILGATIVAKPDSLDARLRLAELRLSQNSPQSALTLLSPVKDSTDPRVQKLLAAVQAKIAKDRSY